VSASVPIDTADFEKKMSIRVYHETSEYVLLAEGSLASQTQPSVLLAAAKWWPLSARLAAVLLHHGCRVAAVCPSGHPLNYISGIEKTYRYAGVFSLSSLRDAILDWSPDVIVPCDDGVVAQLHAIYACEHSLHEVIERSLGSPSSYPVVRSRYQLLTLAAESGVRVPRMARVANRSELANWHDNSPGPAVLKIDGESAGNGVRVCHSMLELLSAWDVLSEPIGRAAAWKRLWIDGNPLTVWQSGVATPPEVTIQEFINGRPANSMMFCQRGKVVALVSVIVVAAESSVGAATIVRVIDDPRITTTAERLAQRLELSGFFGLDFIVDESGEPFLIELNPRCTQLGHLEFPKRASLAAHFAASMRGKAPPPPKHPITRRTIALFPQAQSAGEHCSAYIAASFHDVPQDQPELVEELKLRSWPQRQWRSRLYHFFFRFRPGDPVVFEPPDFPDASTVSEHRLA
jgi:hypothetical protein